MPRRACSLFLHFSNWVFHGHCDQEGLGAHDFRYPALPFQQLLMSKPITSPISHKAATTLSEYENLLNSRWRPLYGNRPIAEISYEELALDVADFPRMAAKTFNNVMTPARQVWALAFKMRKVPENITLEIESRKGQDPEPDPLLMSEVLQVVQYIGEHFNATWRNYFEVALFTDVRPSEQIALQWPSVDLSREHIRIDRAQVRRHNKATKTYKSRDVDLQGPALEAIRRQRQLTFEPGGHVFLNPETGKPFVDTADAVRKVLRPTLAALGIREAALYAEHLPPPEA